MKLKLQLSIIISLILIIISISLRIPKNGINYKSSDATYHTLYTMKCYDDTPVTIHKFLPLVSLGEEGDKNIPWGACILGKHGNFYYTSFSAFGFVVPFLFVKLFRLPININSIYILNSILCVATLITMIAIFCQLFKKYIDKSTIILLTSISYLFFTEVMQSQGAVFWVHSIFQFLIGIQFLLFMNFQNKKAKIGFYIMCVIMPFAEWTGFISNFAFAIVFFIKDAINNKKISIQCLKKTLFIGFLTLLSLLLFCLHFLMNIEPDVFFESLKIRFLSRAFTVSNVNVKDLINGYFLSYKYMILLDIFMFIFIVCIKKLRIKLWELIKEYKDAVIFFILIQLENIIMLQHAVSYTYDRLKFAYILLLVFFIMLSTFSIIKNKSKNLILLSTLIILILTSVLNIRNYTPKNSPNYLYNINYQDNNNTIVNYIKENYNDENSIVCSNGIVRGYTNLLFGRGIYELREYDSCIELLNDKNKDYLIYIYSVPNTQYEQSDEIYSVVIYDKLNNSIKKVYTIDSKLVVE